MSEFAGNKCDRCNTIYQPFDLGYPFNVGGLSLTRRYGAQFNPLDLCRDCCRSLAVWWHEEARKATDENGAAS